MFAGSRMYKARVYEHAEPVYQNRVTWLLTHRHSPVATVNVHHTFDHPLMDVSYEPYAHEFDGYDRFPNLL